jgi:hypothetical protein
MPGWGAGGGAGGGPGAKAGRKPSRRRKEVAPAAEAIAAALAMRGLQAPVREHRLITEWRDMVGDRVAARTWPDGLKDRVLWVRVASSAWLHELTLLKAQLIAGIDAVLGAPPVVADIRFHLGARKQVDDDDLIARAAMARRRPPPKPPKPLPPPASGEARAKIEREAATVADDELRALIAQVRIRHDK